MLVSDKPHVISLLVSQFVVSTLKRKGTLSPCILYPVTAAARVRPSPSESYIAAALLFRSLASHHHPRTGKPLFYLAR